MKIVAITVFVLAFKIANHQSVLKEVYITSKHSFKKINIIQTGHTIV